MVIDRKAHKRKTASGQITHVRKTQVNIDQKQTSKTSIDRSASLEIEDDYYTHSLEDKNFFKKESPTIPWEQPQVLHYWKEPEEGDRSPWGEIQNCAISTNNGVAIVTTASHGGVRVAPELNNKIPSAFRSKSGWYEEDCNWAIPAYFIPEEYVKVPRIYGAEHQMYNPVYAKRMAEKTLRRYYPDKFEKFLARQTAPAINKKTKFTEDLVENILANDEYRQKYGNANNLYLAMDKEGIINRSNEFVSKDAYNKFVELHPLYFENDKTKGEN
jgi:hypothetical protein